MIKKPRGTEDILPSDIDLWRLIEDTAREVCNLYGYKEIRTPVFEDTSLFSRGVGDNTDVVQKAMYTFNEMCIRESPRAHSPIRYHLTS